MKTFSILAVLFLLPLCKADPVDLTNAEAQKLWVALSQIPEGFTVTNATFAADDANTLLPKVQAFERAMAGRMRVLKVTQAMLDRHDDSPGTLQYLAEADSAGETKISVDLARFELTSEEISKVRVSVVAVLRQFLRPVPVKK